MRTFKKSNTLIVVTLLLLISCAESDKKSLLKKPNIIVFLVDDMGWQDTSVAFWKEKTPLNNLYRTPNMQRLANEGMMFTQAYATSVCSPTRVSLMTGMNAARHRVTNWTLHKDTTHAMEINHPTLIYPKWNVNGLSTNPNTNRAVIADPLPKILNENGYNTIHTGKAHFGAIGTPGEDPKNIGFDINIAGHAAGAPKSYLGTQNFGNTPESKDSPWPVPGLTKYHGKDIYLSEALTIETLNTLDSLGTTKPFFLYMAHYAVHTPIMKDERFIQNYDSTMHPTEAAYATMVEGMDKSLGDIMDYLKRKNLEKNTIILFMSDNGGLSAVARGGERHTHNKPLSSGKGSAREGGVREPMIVKWPGITSNGSKNESYLIIEDFFPTILEMAGVSKEKTVQHVDGISFKKALKGEKLSYSRPLIWHYPNEWGPKGPGIGATSAVRLGDYKLIYYHINQSFELFNLSLDIGEENNLASSNTEKLKELADILTAELKRYNAQMTALKSTGEMVPYPSQAIVDSSPK